MTEQDDRIAVLERRLNALSQQYGDLLDRIDAHQGLDWGKYGLQYPHPNLSIDTAEYGGGVMRIDSTGTQIKSVGSTRQGALRIVKDFYTPIDTAGNPPSGTDLLHLKANIAADDDMYWELYIMNDGSGATPSNASGLQGYIDSNSAEIGMVVRHSLSGWSVPQAAWLDTDTAGSGAPVFWFQNCLLEWPISTTTWSAAVLAGDGRTYYQSTTDKFIGRAAGAVDNFAMEGWVNTTAVLLANANWTDLTDGGATTLHSHAGGAGMSLIVKEADETVNNSAVLQNDNELLFAVAANEVWQFEGILTIVTNSTADFQLTFTGPTGAVGSFGAIGIDTTGVQDADGAILGTAAFLEPTVGVKILRFWGGIHNGANAGSLTLQWSQQNAAVFDTIVRAGSYLKYQIET